MITLDDVLRRIEGRAHNIKPATLSISNVVFNSNEIIPGSLYVAVRGTKHDGHSFVGDAFKKGASLAIVEDAGALGSNPGVVVANTRKALSQLSALYFNDPSKEISVIGITGTNGKTTTNWMLYHLLNFFGAKSLRIGTLGVKSEGRIDLPGNLTTPDPYQIQRLFREAMNGGASSCVMEVSSHALEQSRADDIEFDVGVFTNLTRDHLDYHNDMESYFQAKQKLFRLVAGNSKKIKAAVINCDDEYGKLLIQDLASDIELYSFGRSEGAALHIQDFEQTLRSGVVCIRYQGSTYKIASPFVGFHNAQNISAAFGSMIALGYEAQAVADALGKIPQVPGRLESVGQAPFGVYVDYAHTPDALQNVLSALQGLVQNELWVLFGCGGDRDKGKRPQMAQIASRMAHKVVVTSDNPRTEDPQAIIDDILSEGVNPTLVEVDRRRAIEQTLQAARPGDVVLIAGKGHEDYQIIGTEKFHFSDAEEVQKVLIARGYT